MQVPWNEQRYGEVRVTREDIDDGSSGKSRVIHYRGREVALDREIEDLSTDELRERFDVMEKSLDSIRSIEDTWFESMERLILLSFVAGFVIAAFDMFGEHTLEAAGAAIGFGFVVTFAVPVVMLYSHHFGRSGLTMDMTQELTATWFELEERSEQDE